MSEHKAAELLRRCLVVLKQIHGDDHGADGVTALIDDVEESLVVRPPSWWPNASPSEERMIRAWAAMLAAESRGSARATEAEDVARLVAAGLGALREPRS